MQAATARFDFFANIGEGQYEIYNVAVEPKENGGGRLCYATTIDLGDDVTERVAEAAEQGKTLRDDVIPINRFRCGDFYLFGYGWFKVPLTVKSEIGVENFEFVFVGSLDPTHIEGQVYQFREFKPQGEKAVYRTVRVIDVKQKPELIQQKRK